MRLIAAFLLSVALLGAQVVTIDGSGNVTANGSYNSGTASGAYGKLTLNGSTSGIFGIRVNVSPLTYNWLIPDSTSPTNNQFLTFGTPVSGDVPINYRTIVSGDLPPNLTDSFGAALLPNPAFNRLTAGNLASGDTALYTCPTTTTPRYCMVVSSTYYKANTGTATALLEYKAGGTGSYIPFHTLSLASAAGTTPDLGDAIILTPGDVLGVNISGTTGENVWVAEIEFDETSALVPVRVTSGFVSGNNTLYTVPSGKSALILGTGFSAPGLSNGAVRYFNNSGSSTNASLYLVPSGGSAGTTNEIGSATSLATGTLNLFQVNATLNAGDFIVANVNSTSSSQIFYLNLLVY